MVDIDTVENQPSPPITSSKQQFAYDLLGGKLPVIDSANQDKQNSSVVSENKASLPLYKQTEFNPPPIPEKPTREDFLHVLGLNSDSSFEEAQIAFRSLARRFHPDINSEKNSTEAFLVINNAYDGLKKLEFPESRKPEVAQLDTVPPNTREGILSLFKENSTIQHLQELKENGGIGNVPEDVGKIEETEGRSWKDCLALVALLTLDVTLNNGRGIAAFAEDLLQNEVNYKLVVPALHFFNIDDSTIEKIISGKGVASKGIFELQPEVIKTVVENMTPFQRRDLVESLSEEEKKSLLINGKDPYNRLDKKTIDELFKENNLPPNYIGDMKKRFA